MWIFLLLASLACSGDKSGEPPKEITEEKPLIFENCEQTINEHACDFQLTNQDGIPVNLYDFYGKPIVLDFSTEWCFYCVLAASETQFLANTFSGEDLQYVTVLIEDQQGNPATTQTAAKWAETHGIITEQVLVGSRDLFSDDPTAGWFLESWPTFYFIDKNMVIRGYLRGYSEDSLLQGIELILKEDSGQ